MDEIATVGLTCFRSAVLSGLSGQDKTLPGKYLYDRHGMALFEQLSSLPDYYFCRAESRLLAASAVEVAASLGHNANLVEFGCGRSRKARFLIEALPAPLAYAAVDLCREALLDLCREVAAHYPRLAVFPLWADFMGSISLPFERHDGRGRVLAFFPGSIIGNLGLREARDLLVRTGRLVGSDGAILVSIDERKARERLIASHDDPAGLAAALNRNLLHRINRELDGDLEPDRFEHEALWNGREGRIEIALVSRREQKARAAGAAFHFGRREPIRTGFAYKYTIEEFRWLAGAAGLKISRSWHDRRNGVSLHLLSLGGSADCKDL